MISQRFRTVLSCSFSRHLMRGLFQPLSSISVDYLFLTFSFPALHGATFERFSSAMPSVAQSISCVILSPFRTFLGEHRIALAGVTLLSGVSGRPPCLLLARNRTLHERPALSGTSGARAWSRSVVLRRAHDWEPAGWAFAGALNPTIVAPIAINSPTADTRIIRLLDMAMSSLGLLTTREVSSRL